MISDNGIASCIDVKTGTPHWQVRVGGNHSASPLYADGRIYFLSEEGESVVIAPGKEFKAIAKNQLDGTDAGFNGGLERLDLHSQSNPSLPFRHVT